MFAAMSSDLKHFIRVYDDGMEPAFAARMVESFHGLSRYHQRNGRGMRAGLEESAWTELNVSRLSDPAFAAAFRRMIDAGLARYNADVGLTIPVPASPLHAELVLKRYQPGVTEQFQLHFDSIYHKANRYLVFLWYLNDVAAGGETRFPQLDVSVAPRAGRLLMFPPYWMYQHEGRPPVSGDKYILSTYLLFPNGPPPAPPPIS
jgi:prolyl 4-hydroxylase